MPGHPHSPPCRGRPRAARQLWHWIRRRTSDRGTLTLFTAIVAIGLLAALGFIADAGVKLQAGNQARALAEEAARAGTGQVNQSAAYAHGGTFTVDPDQAIAAAQAYLSQSGHTGSVTVEGGRTIQVTVTVTEPAIFTTIIGISRLSDTQTASANLFQGITGPQP
jgi:Flp pilus assembly protein TadG